MRSSFTERTLEEILDSTHFSDLGLLFHDCENGRRDINDPAVLAEIDMLRPGFVRHLNRQAEIIQPILACAAFFKYLPTPTSEDTGYADYYRNLLSTQRMKDISDRFELSDSIDFKGETLRLSDGHKQYTIPAMALSYKHFISDSVPLLESYLQSQNELRELSIEKVMDVLQQVNDDVQRSVINPCPEQIANNTLLIGCTVRPDKYTLHAFAIVFSYDLCLITDKARDGVPGVEIFQVPADKNKDKLKLAKDCNEARTKVLNDFPVMSTETFTKNLIKQLNMHKVGSIELASQAGANCAWSSCAKSILFCALYARFRQTTGSHEVSEKYARYIKRIWSHMDKLNYLRNFIEEIAHKKAEAHPVLLAEIIVKYQYRPDKAEFLKLISDSGLVQEEHIKQARENLYQRVVNEFQEAYPILCKIFKKDLHAVSSRIFELSLLISKRQVDGILRSISLISLTPFKDAIRLLDNEIVKAKSITSKRPAILMFSSGSGQTIVRGRSNSNNPQV